MWYTLTADIIVIIHFLFVVFVVAGGLLVLKWRWVVYGHIPAAIWGALLEFMGWGCPLTPLEKSLRIAAGGEGYEGGFIQHYLVPLIYPGVLTRATQIWIGLVVILVNLVIYSRIIKQWKQKTRKP